MIDVGKHAPAATEPGSLKWRWFAVDHDSG
jgi:hypothetical protein